MDKEHFEQELEEWRNIHDLCWSSSEDVAPKQRPTSVEHWTN